MPSLPNISKEELIDRLTQSLPELRACLGLSQADLAAMLDISRQSVVAMENRKRRMSWDTCLAIFFLFMSNHPTRKLLNERKLYTPELEAFLHVQTPRGA